MSNTEAPKDIFPKMVANLFESGLQRQDIGGFHGTTIEAIRHLANFGTLPTTGTYADVFYFAQIDDKNQAQDQIKRATAYAEWNAKKRFILDRLPFKPKDPEVFMYALASDKLYDEIALESISHGMTKDQLARLFNSANSSNRRGVLLSLSSDILQLPLSHEDENQSSTVIPGGLSINYINGIEPLGQYEWDVLVEMQDNY